MGLFLGVAVAIVAVLALVIRVRGRDGRGAAGTRSAELAHQMAEDRKTLGHHSGDGRSGPLI